MELNTKKVIGKRIRLARDMAGLTQKDLVRLEPEKLGENPSIISNWENGKHKPDHDQIEAIARSTGTSPSWILMGYGPICSGNRDIQAIRHQNLNFRWTELDFSDSGNGSQQSISLQEVIGYLCDPKCHIKDETARRFEQALGKPDRWMDEQHVDHDPVLQSLPDGIREILNFYSEMPEKHRHFVMEVIGALKRSLDRMEMEEIEENSRIGIHVPDETSATKSPVS